MRFRLFFLCLLCGALASPAIAQKRLAAPALTLWSWGSDYAGELGNGTTIGSATPGPVISLTGVVSIAGGFGFSLALTSDGTVWEWGDDTYGERGNGTFTPTAPYGFATPGQVSGLSNVVAIAGGYFFAVALKSDGTVWAWGENASGQLGNGTITTASPYGIPTPVQVTGLSNVIAIAAGMALESDGTVWTWGDGSSGQLGNGTFNNSATPVQVPGLSNVVAIAAGAFHNLAITSDGTVWAWGNNQFGQLGNGTFTTTGNEGIATPAPVPGLSNVVAIAGGTYHSLALTSDGAVWGWGLNDYGQLGNGAYNEPPGNIGVATPGQAVGLSGVVAISAGYAHSLALKSDGTVWAFGDNTYGEIGNGVIPTAGPYGVATPTQAVGLSEVVAISAGGLFGMALSAEPLTPHIAPPSPLPAVRFPGSATTGKTP